jgi:hypothetical protein
LLDTTAPTVAPIVRISLNFAAIEKISSGILGGICIVAICMATILGTILYRYLRRIGKTRNLSKVYVEESPTDRPVSDEMDTMNLSDEMRSKLASYELSSELFVRQGRRTRAYRNIAEPNSSMRVEDAQDV